jgi:transcription initiation factor TFIIIB Brf1 subunit/transcription initiation factor TFIIB
LQLVGITAMLLASKYEEIYTPEVRDFIWITAKAYTREDVLNMERNILVTLNFNLSTPTPLHFLRRFSKAARSDSKIHTLSKYITELSLLEYKMLEYLPSQIAAAAVYISRKMCGISPLWVN